MTKDDFIWCIRVSLWSLPSIPPSVNPADQSLFGCPGFRRLVTNLTPLRFIPRNRGLLVLVNAEEKISSESPMSVLLEKLNRPLPLLTHKHHRARSQAIILFFSYANYFCVYQTSSHSAFVMFGILTLCSTGLVAASAVLQLNTQSLNEIRESGEHAIVQCMFPKFS